MNYEKKNENGCGRKYEDWFEKERCIMQIKADYRRNSDCCLVEVSQVTLTC